MLRRVRLYMEGCRRIRSYPANTLTDACARRYHAFSKETKTVIWLMPIVVVAVGIMGYILSGYGQGYNDGDDDGDEGPGEPPTPGPLPDEPFAWEPDDDEDWNAFLDLARTNQWDHDLRVLTETVPV